MYKTTLKALDISIESYEHRDVNKASSINSVESEIDKQHKRYRDLHIKRLHEGICNAYAGAIFLDLLSNLERIGDHSTNIAEIGLSIFCFKRFNRKAPLMPCVSKEVTYDIGVESKVASSNEHNAEITSANDIYTIIRSIIISNIKCQNKFIVNYKKYLLTDYSLRMENAL
mgnify:CR=1 FL=1